MAASAGSIAKKWRDLQGENSWNDLLDPLDLDLRESVISYGELVQATGDGFDKETQGCLYGYTDLLTRTGVAAAGHYTVTKFVYATEKTPIFHLFPESAWIGFVAVATDEGAAALGRRDIVVAWRGTLTNKEIDNDVAIWLVPATPVLGGAAEAFPDAKVHRGFLNLYTSSNADSKLNKLSARDQVLMEVGRLVEMYKDEPACSITVTGHSLGASLAMLNAVDIAANGWNTPVTSSSSLQPPCPVTAIVFACPRTGNDSFKSAFDSFRDLRALHVRNAIDIVPDYPSEDRGYVDMGVLLNIDTTLSPYLKDPKNTAHNLECYLHGRHRGFKLVVNRNVALVNKDADALKDGYPVPAQWWALQTSFMLMNAPGKWELKDFNEIAKNAIDDVPKIPPECLGYVDMGVPLLINTTLSPYLNDDPENTKHNLDRVLPARRGWGAGQRHRRVQAGGEPQRGSCEQGRRSTRSRMATRCRRTAMAALPENGSIAKRWRELHGKDSWNGLLDPLDLDLRRSIISYGELAQATYDTFNTERRSPHAGASMFGYEDLLTSSGVAAAGHYEVTKFIYATSGLPLPESFLLLPLPALKDAWSRESNFMGYVAVATDEGAAALGRRDIVVAWRGTVKGLEWVNDLSFAAVPAAPVLGSAARANPLAVVHAGFLSLYTSSDAGSKFNQTSARDQVLAEVRRLVELYKDEETSITVTGHSLGAAVSILNAVDLVANGVNAPPPPVDGGSSPPKPPCPVTAIVFACPHAGDRFFRAAFSSFKDLRALHVKNLGDVVPAYPPVGYVDVAVALPINTSRSPFLKWPGTVLTLHNLECYLHGVAGEQGGAGGFELEVERDVALVNKRVDALTDEHPVPESWWVIQNKGMVKSDEEQRWVLKDFKQI
ncbi:hypothetical protein U9M48_041578 [Paspalum notatum var. saurae]|uniref:Phospholipase A1 n=1 Tax=Paspalum notatum var. saurae TaxID=547442 RepID=A0AAQ3UQR9_PASNO